MQAQLAATARKAQTVGGRSAGARARKRHNDHVTANAPNVSVGGLTIPNRVRPNTNITVNGSGTYNSGPAGGQFSPDSCSQNCPLFVAGQSTEMKVYADDQLVATSSAKCICAGGGTKNFSVTWTSPNVSDERTIEVRVELVGTSSGRVFDSTTRAVTVTPTAPAQPNPTPGGGGLRLPLLGQIDFVTALLGGGVAFLTLPLLLGILL